VACAATPTAAPTPSSLTVSAPASLQPLLSRLAEEAQARNPSVSIAVRQVSAAQALDEIGDGQDTLSVVAVPLPKRRAGALAGAWTAPIAIRSP